MAGVRSESSRSQRGWTITSSHALGPPADPGLVAVLDHVVERTQDALGDALLSVALYGSAVAGGLRVDSDIDLLVLVDRPIPDDARATLIAAVLEVSGRRATAPVGGWRPARPLELTVVDAPRLRSGWHAPRYELQYGEWLREKAESGDPLGPADAQDVTLLLAQARSRSVPLFGRAVGALVPAPSDDEVRHALRAVVPELIADLDGDERNVLLTLARILVTADTGDFVPKDVAADQVLASVDLVEHDRALLALARDAYRGDTTDDGTAGDAAGLARTLRDRIARLLPGTGGRSGSGEDPH